jgi:site-specific DNA recombinase
VPEEVFGRVQDILVGRRVALSTHTRNHPDFPLRVFVSCGECGVPVTGSWSKGRNNRYSYYRCRNSQCKKMNIRTDKLEEQFVDFIRSLSPESGYLPLFREIVTQVWKQRQADSDQFYGRHMLSFTN